MTNTFNIETALRQALSADLQGAAPSLAQILSSLLASEADAATTQQAIAADVGLRKALQVLGGQRIEASNAVISFGAGSQMGDVTITGSIAGRDVITLHVNLTQIDTGGGDYAEGDIDKRQGAFVKDSTIHGDVIGQVVRQAPLAPALHQLRAPVGDFVGRADALDQIVQALCQTGGAATISGVRGMGGIGKTELAYAVAQRLTAHFPDAQLLVELRGASATPLSPVQALQTLIRAFEREAKLPNDLGQLQSIYRSLLTGKRVLILADDARDATQVRPMLPPHGCALLITSRQHFALPGMAALDLAALLPTEAEALLLGICPRIGSYAASLAKLCGSLPLALRVSASTLKENDDRDVGHFVDQLRTERLRHLSDADTPDDPAASVEASLRLSYDTLDPIAQAALCQLSVFPASFDREAALAIVAVAGQVEEILWLLRRRSLLEWDAALERYNQHELLRVFGAERLDHADAVRLCHAQYYVKVVERAENELYLKGAVPEGLALFDRERAQIDAGWAWALAHAGEPAADTFLYNYAGATAHIGDLRYHTRQERIPQLEAALAAAQRRNNEVGWLLGSLGIAYRNMGDATKAIDFFQQELAIAHEIDNRRGEGQALGNLGTAYLNLGNATKAIDFFQQELAIARELGDRRDEGRALGKLGIAYADLGDATRAINLYQQHLAIAHELGDRRGEGQALGNLGNAYSRLGDFTRAIDYHQQALVIAREIGDRRGEGTTLGNLGIAYLKLGDFTRAIDFFQQDLAVARELGDRSGESRALGNLGVANKNLGEVTIAIDFYQQQLAIARELGDRRGEAYASSNLGLIMEQQGELAQAAELIQILVDFEREIGHPDAEEDAAYVEAIRQRLTAQADIGRDLPAEP